MLRVVKRGLEAELGAVAPPHHYLFHGELVLLDQSFPVYFARLPVGGRADGRVTSNTNRNINPTEMVGEQVFLKSLLQSVLA